jgi:hypothetical protein
MSEVKVNKISPRTNCGTTQLGDAGDTITVTGDLKSNSLKSASGSTITLGQSGDTIQLGCGASQTGFGRTGTVDWDTTAKTASFTAVSGNGYFVNTTSGAITVTLPAGSAGDIVGISDYASTFQTNSVTITPNGTDKINGENENASLSTKGIAVSLVYVDSTRGWKSVTGSDNDTTGAAFISATGGTITCDGNYKIHTFTSPGTFCVSSLAGNPTDNNVDYLVVAGGGGAEGSSPDGGGGGGAGGFRESSGSTTCYTSSPLGAGVSAITVTAQGYPIVVGGGGTCTSSGSDSSGLGIISSGGGAGATSNSPPIPPSNLTGGSGGSQRNAVGFAGNTPPVSPPQGNPGGDGLVINYAPLNYFAGGGGGATQAGADATPAGGGDGGDGAQTGISGTATYYAGGGGAGIAPVRPNVPTQPTTGGLGGGGNNCQNGTANTGGGAGSKVCSVASNGGSGIVVIRYKYR